MTPDRVIQMNMEIAIISAHICLMFPPETVDVVASADSPPTKRARVKVAGYQLQYVTSLLICTIRGGFA